MIKLELTEAQIKTQEGCNDAGIRHVARQLSDTGLPGLDSAISALMAIRDNQRALTAAYQRTISVKGNGARPAENSQDVAVAR
jgi:hypothetical protein